MGANMRFQYTTVTFPASKVGKTVTRYTKYNDGFGRNLEFLDRHNVAAPGKCEFLASFFFQRSGNNMRYRFTTRTVPCTVHARVSTPSVTTLTVKKLNTWIDTTSMRRTITD